MNSQRRSSKCSLQGSRGKAGGGGAILKSGLALNSAVRLLFVAGKRELKETRLVEDDIGEGVTSISLTPTGVNGVRESAKCQAPSGRRTAIRMSSPGLCSIFR